MTEQEIEVHVPGRKPETLDLNMELPGALLCKEIMRCLGERTSTGLVYYIFGVQDSDKREVLFDKEKVVSEQIAAVPGWKCDSILFFVGSPGLVSASGIVQKTVTVDFSAPATGKDDITGIVCPAGLTIGRLRVIAMKKMEIDEINDAEWCYFLRESKDGRKMLRLVEDADTLAKCLTKSGTCSFVMIKQMQDIYVKSDGREMTVSMDMKCSKLSDLENEVREELKCDQDTTMWWFGESGRAQEFVLLHTDKPIHDQVEKFNTLSLVTAKEESIQVLTSVQNANKRITYSSGMLESHINAIGKNEFGLVEPRCLLFLKTGRKWMESGKTLKDYEDIEEIFLSEARAEIHVDRLDGSNKKMEVNICRNVEQLTTVIAGEFKIPGCRRYFLFGNDDGVVVYFPGRRSIPEVIGKKKCEKVRFVPCQKEIQMDTHWLYQKKKKKVYYDLTMTGEQMCAVAMTELDCTWGSTIGKRKIGDEFRCILAKKVHDKEEFILVAQTRELSYYRARSTECMVYVTHCMREISVENARDGLGEQMTLDITCPVKNLIADIAAKFGITDHARYCLFSKVNGKMSDEFRSDQSILGLIGRSLLESNRPVSIVLKRLTSICGSKASFLENYALKTTSPGECLDLLWENLRECLQVLVTPSKNHDMEVEYQSSRPTQPMLGVVPYTVHDILSGPDNERVKRGYVCVRRILALGSLLVAAVEIGRNQVVVDDGMELLDRLLKELESAQKQANKLSITARRFVELVIWAVSSVVPGVWAKFYPEGYAGERENAAWFLSDIILPHRDLRGLSVFQPFVELVSYVYVLYTMDKGVCASQDAKVLLPDNIVRLCAVCAMYYDSADGAPQLIGALMKTERWNMIRRKLTCRSDEASGFVSYMEIAMSMVKDKESVEKMDKHIGQVMQFGKIQLFDEVKELKPIQNLDNDGVRVMLAVVDFLTLVCRVDADLSQSKHYMVLMKNREVLVQNLLIVISSPVPCCLKASCINLLAALVLRDPSTENMIKAQGILSKKVIQDGTGIVSDIDSEMKSDKIYLAAAMCRLVGAIMKTGDGTDFAIYHEFLKCVLKHFERDRGEGPKDNTGEYKWATIGEMCQAWVNGLERVDYEEVCDVILEDVIRGARVIGDLLRFMQDHTMSLEAIAPLVKLLLLFCRKEKRFLEQRRASGSACPASIMNQLSRSIDGKIVGKIMRCAGCRFHDLPISALGLVEEICVASPLIFQTLLAKREANTLSVCNRVISRNASETAGESNSMNVRCCLLRFLLRLGPGSLLVRYLGGFGDTTEEDELEQQHDIFRVIVKKLSLKRAAVLYPGFTSTALELLLVTCDLDEKARPLFRSLRSEDKFFTDMLNILTEEGSDKKSIGYFLQLVAREAGRISDCSLTDEIMKVFDNLVGPSMTILGFIGQIDASEGAVEIAKGLSDIAVAFMSNPYMIGDMEKDKRRWQLTWINIIKRVLEMFEKLEGRTNGVKTAEQMANALAVIGERVLRVCFLGTVGIERRVDVFRSSVKALSNLVDLEYAVPRLGVYSLAQSALSKVKVVGENLVVEGRTSVRAQYEESRRYGRLYAGVVQIALREDSVSEIPVLRMAAFSFVEASWKISAHLYLGSFVSDHVAELPSDWRYYDESPGPGSMCIGAKCSLLTRYICGFDNEKAIEQCNALVGEMLVVRLCHAPFWNSLTDTTGQASDLIWYKLKTATKIMKLMTTIAVTLPEGEAVKAHIKLFLSTFEDAMKQIVEWNVRGVDKVSISFLAEFATFLSVIEDLSMFDPKGGADKKWPVILRGIPMMFKRFLAVYEKERRGEKDTGRSKVTGILSRLLSSLSFVLMRMSVRKNVFDAPLFDDWSNTKRPTATVIVSYLRLMYMTDDKNRVIDGGAVRCCLVIIWYHLDRWVTNRTDPHHDPDDLKKQALRFATDEQFNGIQPNELESVLLMKVRQLATKKKHLTR